LRAAERQRKGKPLRDEREPEANDWRRRRVNALAGFVQRSGNLPLQRVRLEREAEQAEAKAAAARSRSNDAQDEARALTRQREVAEAELGRLT
jgi:hypothetical protein